jgi:hypothetical protein
MMIMMVMVVLLTYLLTPWSRVLLEKLTVNPAFMELESSSPYPQAPAMVNGYEFFTKKCSSNLSLIASVFTAERMTNKSGTV